MDFKFNATFSKNSKYVYSPILRSTDGSQYRIQYLDAGSFSVAGGVNLAGPEPWNIRHVVDENSPIKHYHWDDLEN